MNRKILMSILIIVCSILTPKVNAQDSLLIRKMYEANGQHFQDPRAPRFLFMDKEGKVALGIGGYVKGTMSVDMDGISDNLDFVTADIPAPPQTNMRNQFQMDASTSRIFLKLVGNDTQVGDFTVYLETDFRGKNGHQYDLRLRQAFIQLGGWKVGKARTTFADAAACPPTIDFEGPSGSVSTKNTMIQYSHQFGKHWSTAMAIETPSASYTTDKNLQAQYVSLLEAQGVRVALMEHMIDTQFASVLEAYNSGVSFLRVDSDIADVLKSSDEEMQRLVAFVFAECIGFQMVSLGSWCFFRN